MLGCSLVDDGFPLVKKWCDCRTVKVNKVSDHLDVLLSSLHHLKQQTKTAHLQ